MINAQLSGGWSEPRPPTLQDMKVFAEALSGFVGVAYTPYLVSTQVVNGTNYAFLCGAQSATNPANAGFAVITAHKNLGGKVYLTDIKTCGMV